MPRSSKSIKHPGVVITFSALQIANQRFPAVTAGQLNRSSLDLEGGRRGKALLIDLSNYKLMKVILVEGLRRMGHGVFHHSDLHVHGDNA